MAASGPASGASRGDELTPGGAAVVIAVFIGGAAIGYPVGGLAGSFIGAILGAAVCVGVFGTRRMRRTDRLGDGNLPSLEGLDRRQAMTVMSAMLGGTQGDAFRSELLAELEAAHERVAQDPTGALAAVEALRKQHPRSPAVHAELARCRLALGQETEAVAAIGEALRCALDGGMNPMAAHIFEEFEAQRDTVSLTPRHAAQLARVLRSRGNDDAASWCDARAEG